MLPSPRRWLRGSACPRHLSPSEIVNRRSPPFCVEPLEDRLLLSLTPVTNTTQFPFSAVVQVTATFPDGTTYQGSGTMVNPNTVLTAGHMVYHSSSGGWATSVEVKPGLNGSSTPYGVAHSVQVQTFDSFIADDQQNPNIHPPGDGDIGFISLDRDLGDLTGWLGFLGASSSNYNVNKYGYPGADGFSGAQMYADSGSLNDHSPGIVSGFSFWGWPTSSLSALPGESGSSLLVNQGGNLGIIGVQDVGGNNEGYAEVTTQAVLNALTSFENAHPPTGKAGTLVVNSAPVGAVNAGGNYSLTIAAQDGSGNTLTAYASPVTLSILNGPAGGILVGNVSVSASGGVAVFSNLTLSTPGTYKLLASAPNLKDVTVIVTVGTPPTSSAESLQPGGGGSVLASLSASTTAQSLEKEALEVALGLKTLNISLILLGLDNFQSFLATQPLASQPVLALTFFNDLMADLV
jgi:V8-like Glu-specific endopeptidase